MKITTDAEDDIDRQDAYDKDALTEAIKERLSPPRDADDIRYIHKPRLGIEFHRLKLKEDGFDHRIYFDYQDNELVVFAVRHRNYAYTDTDLDEAAERLHSLHRD